MKAHLIKEIEPGKLYGSSALRAARHFWTVSDRAQAIALADELQTRPDVLVVAVLDYEGKAIGIILRDRLFALLSKSFGREVLGRMRVAELVENAPVFDAHTGIFTIAEQTLKSEAFGRAAFHILTDIDGTFRGVLSSQDLADYLSRMTQDDIELAGKLQERLQAGNEEVAGGPWRLEAWSRPAKGVGGDFYFTKRLTEDRFFFALCDVSGKGVAASLVVSMIWGMLRMFDYDLGLETLILRLNESIVGTFHLEKYLTGFFAIAEGGSGTLLVADMGHSHCFLLRGENAFVPHNPKPNLPIGIDAAMRPYLARWRLEKGDSLLVYSDGLSEQEDEAGFEFGAKRLVETIKRSRISGSSPSEDLSSEIDRYRARTPQQDDMSFILLTLY